MLRSFRTFLKENRHFPETAGSAVDVSDVHAGETAGVTKDDNEEELSLQEIKRLRKQRGLKEIPVSNHLVFYGNPGTGKTNVARLLAKI